MLSQGNKEYPKYDFKKQQPIPDKRKLTLAYIFHLFASKASKTLSSFFQNPVNLSVVSLEQAPLSQLLSWFTYPTSFASLEISPLKENAIFEINPAISYPAINFMLGGGGEAPSVSYSLSNLELAVSRKFINMLLKDLEEAWNPFIDLGFTVNEISNTPSQSFLESVPKSEAYLIVRFDVTWKLFTGLMTIAIPVASLEPINEILESFTEEVPSHIHHLVQKETPTEYIDLKKIEVELIARLGTINISNPELHELQPGDILLLDQKTHQPIDIVIGQEIPFTGIPGVIGKHKGILIRQTQNQQPKGVTA